MILGAFHPHQVESVDFSETALTGKGKRTPGWLWQKGFNGGRQDSHTTPLHRPRVTGNEKPISNAEKKVREKKPLFPSSEVRYN